MMRSRTAALGLVAATLSSLLGSARPASCQPTAAIDPEVVYRSAVDDLKAGRYADACPKFAEARRLKPDSTPALQGLAQCYDKAGKTASAWAKYRQLSVELKQAGDPARSDAASSRAAELEQGLSTLEIKPEASSASGLVIRLDKEEVPRAMFGTRMNVDPGQHILEATAPGYEVWQTTVTIGARNDAKQLLVPPLVAKPLDPTQPGAPSGSPVLRTTAYAVGGIGAAGLVAGAVLGGLAVGAAKSVKSECPGNICLPAHQGALSSANTEALASTVALGVGGAALATGIVLFIVSRPSARKDDAPRAAQLVPTFGFGPHGGGGLSVIGRF
jgi:hypothetical protein